jgi:oligoribonuclease NrnB/cAMP/cGMP phosphodiesterase (DHH superfamily)
MGESVMAEINLDVSNGLDMLSAVSNKPKKLVLYHANCADGFCAAWVCWKKFKDDAEYVPVQYGQAPPDVRGREVYIVDFSYNAFITTNLILAAESMVILDHHKTAQEALHPFKSTKIIFDMKKSGGRLTWEYLFPGENPPWLVFYTEDRDLWHFALPNSREVNDCLSSYPFDFNVWEAFSNYRLDGNEFSQLIQEGAAIQRYKQQLVDCAIEHAVEINIGGHYILAVNSTVLFSEVAGKLAEGRPFGATYFIRKDGKKVWSLRSSPDGVDVSEVAKKYGGGGHKHAAGFEEKV